MNVIKRDGREAIFDRNKIVNAIKGANNDVEPIHKLNDYQIEAITDSVTKKIESFDRAASVEEIQDLVEKGIMEARGYEVAQEYVRYRFKRSLIRKANTTDDKILSIIDCVNEEAKQENSNKDPDIVSVQRDYMAGEVSRDITERLLLDDDIVEAHKNGVIHFHDTDYFAQRMYNCCLVNMEDMLQNGTVISETKIDSPHTFATACNIATQIVADRKSVV